MLRANVGVSFNELSVGCTRRTAAGVFYELMTLQSLDYIHLSQPDAYGDIYIRAGPNFKRDKDGRTEEEGEEEPTADEDVRTEGAAHNNAGEGYDDDGFGAMNSDDGYDDEDNDAAVAPPAGYDEDNDEDNDAATAAAAAQRRGSFSSSSSSSSSSSANVTAAASASAAPRGSSSVGAAGARALPDPPSRPRRAASSAAAAAAASSSAAAAEDYDDDDDDSDDDGDDESDEDDESRPSRSRTSRVRREAVGRRLYGEKVATPVRPSSFLDHWTISPLGSDLPPGPTFALNGTDVDKVSGFLLPRALRQLLGSSPFLSLTLADYASGAKMTAGAAFRKKHNLRLLTIGPQISVHASKVDALVKALHEQQPAIGCTNTGATGGGQALCECKRTIPLNKLLAALEKSQDFVHFEYYGQKEELTDTTTECVSAFFDASRVAVPVMKRFYKTEGAIEHYWTCDVGVSYKQNPLHNASPVHYVFGKIYHAGNGVLTKVFEILQLGKENREAGTVAITLNPKKLRSLPGRVENMFPKGSRPESLAFLDDIEMSGLRDIRLYQDFIHLLRSALGYDSAKFHVNESSTVQHVKELVDKLSRCFHGGDETHPNSVSYYREKVKSAKRGECRFGGSSDNIPDIKKLRTIARHFEGTFLSSFLKEGAELQAIPVLWTETKLAFFKEYGVIRHLLRQRDSTVLNATQVSLVNDFLVRALILAGYNDQALQLRRKEERTRSAALPTTLSAATPLSLLLITTSLDTPGGVGGLNDAESEALIWRFDEDFKLTDAQKKQVPPSSQKSVKDRLKLLVTSTVLLLDKKPDIVTLRGRDGPAVFQFVRGSSVNIDDLKEEACTFENRLPCVHKQFEKMDFTDAKVRDALVVHYANFHALAYDAVTQHLEVVVRGNKLATAMVPPASPISTNTGSKMTLVRSVVATLVSRWKLRWAVNITRPTALPSHTARSKADNKDKVLLSDVDSWILKELHSLMKDFKLHPCPGSCAFCQHILHTNTLTGKPLEVLTDLDRHSTMSVGPTSKTFRLRLKTARRSCKQGQHLTVSGLKETTGSKGPLSRGMQKVEDDRRLEFISKGSPRALLLLAEEFATKLSAGEETVKDFLLAHWAYKTCTDAACANCKEVRASGNADNRWENRKTINR